MEVVASNNVTNGTEGGCLDRRRRMHEEVDETPADARLDNGLNLIVGAVGEVRNSPTGVDEDLIVQGVDQFGEHGESRGDLEE